MTKINARTKGANGEREVADILQRVVNEVAIKCGYVAPRIRRNTEQSQIGGEDLVGLPWYSIEVKRVERVDLPKWWAQTVAQAGRKAAGSSSWDALVRGGWRRLAADAAGAAAEAQAGLGPVEAARGALGEAQGQEAARAGSGDVGSARVAGERVDGLCTSVERAHETGPACAGGGLALPVWGVRREPVLLWRVNRSPWQVRCFLDVCIAGNTETRRILCDVSLDDWLPIFRAKLLEILARV